MNRDTERIERYLKGVGVPESASDRHRQQLRRQILGEIERTQTMSVQGKAWRVAAVAALVCTGAIAATVGVQVHRYYAEGPAADGSYVFQTEPEMVFQKTAYEGQGVRSGTVTGVARGTIIQPSAPGQAVDVEQTKRELEEIDRLRQQDLRKLVRVIDTEVNGRFHHRTFCYEYRLSDGRTQTIGENAPEMDGAGSSAQIEKDHEEIARLRQQNRRDLIRVYDTQIGGETFRTYSYRYTLADGRVRTVGEGDPDRPASANPPSRKQMTEILQQRRLNQGTIVGREDRDVHGQPFTFETRVMTLSDGTIATHAVGEPKGFKQDLTEQDWEELHALMGAQKGEDLGTEDRVVLGRAFSFAKQRFLLRDGTQVVWSVGEPMGNQ